MLLLDDDDQLPAAPDADELSLVSQLGADGLKKIDDNLIRQASRDWLKVARVVFNAVKAGGFSIGDENQVRVHVRRVITLAEAGVLSGQGDLKRPRWSEVRLPSGDR